jgi:deoxyribodipyrimidine photo-lyase
VWFRRDLRLDDNPAWAEATSRHDEVVALFVLEPRLLASAGDKRRDQLLGHLGALHEELRERGGGLTVRTGPAVDALPRAVADANASAVYLNADVSPFSVERDAAVLDALAVPVEAFHGLTVHEPGRVLTQAGEVSQVFTPFYKTWAKTPLSPWPEPGSASITELRSDRLPAPDGELFHEPGSAAAWRRLQAWLERVDDYPDTRNLPAIDGTSELSADLKFGTLAARTVLEAAGTSTDGRAAFTRQLAWRDWYAHTLAVRPDLPHAAVKAHYDRIAWRNDPQEFEAWCAGQTGYPIVDAGMRQLNQTGWMHNRLRMVTAMFLTKNLLIDWRWGERYFMTKLIDGDLAANNGGWQWSASTGTDSVPYFRIFNPFSQSKRFDPEGTFIKKMCPELEPVPAKALHDPKKLSVAINDLGLDYPGFIVDYKRGRERALAAFKSLG